MPDLIAKFSLSSPTSEELCESFAYSVGEFEAWHSQAYSVSKFASRSLVAGLDQILRSEINQSLQFMLDKGLLKDEFTLSQREAFINQGVQQQLRLAEHASKTAAIVMLHNACERLLWRLVRFAMFHNRNKACEFIKDRTCKVSDLRSLSQIELIDLRLEDWWEQLEKESILRKWNTLIALVGFPPAINSHPNWHFDLQMLAEFDSVRVNAVHHDGQEVAKFDFPSFASQLERALITWVTELGLAMQLKPSAEKFFGMTRFRPPEAKF